ncbi:MAG: integrase arm-type DNA-binding domain-containing protein [Hyphomicrobiales bacterium]|nr:integrase arm-type DNA-binding domain-containing protein [Hyphomicrobiales bacterium]
MKLTDSAVRNAKPGSKTYRLPDGRGLYLVVPTTGNKRWLFRYRFAGKENAISFRLYPEVSLKDARRQREEARELLIKGIDPNEQRKIDKFQKAESDQNTFEIVSKAWFNSQKNKWTKGYQVKVVRMLERKLHPWIGNLPIRKITPPILLKVLRKTESEGKFTTAHTMKQIAGQVFRFAVATGQAERDITFDLRGALTTAQKKHMAAIIDPKEVGRLMLAIDGYEGSPEVCCALRLAPHVFARPGELRKAEWSEIDFDKSLWCIDAEKMKMRNDHIVPLSRQSLAILREIRLITGNYRYVFPSARSTTRPMSENAVLVALRTMGYTKDKMTGHGFRAMARTLIDEELGYRPDWIEQQLAHVVKDPLGRAYNRTKHLKERVKMMQKWSNYLDDLKAKAAANAG